VDRTGLKWTCSFQLTYPSPVPIGEWQLEATVWHCEALNVNLYMGGVLVDLSRLHDGQCIDEWFRLVDVFS
jgi:hypothetical protein